MADATAQEYKQEQRVADAVLGVERGTDRQKAAAKKIRAEVQEKPAETVLKNLKAEGMGPLAEVDIEATLDRIISADKEADGSDKRDPTTNKKERSGTNRAHFDRAKQNLEEANTILKDFRNIPPPERPAMFGKIQTMLRVAYPEAADVMATATTQAERDEILENIFRNPEFARILHGKMEGILKQEKHPIPADLADRVANAQKDYTLTDIEYQSKLRAHKSAEKDANEFDTTTPGNGAKQQELERLEAQKDTLQTRKQDAQREVDRIQANLDTLNTRFNKLNDASVTPVVARAGNNNIQVGDPVVDNQVVKEVMAQINREQNKLAKAKEALENSTQQLDRIEKLKEEKSKAQETLETAEKDLAMSKANREAAQNRLTNAKIEMDEAKLGVHEDKFLHETDNVVEDSVRDFLADQVKKADDKRIALLEEAEKKATDKKKEEEEHEITELVRERWHKRGRMRKGRIQEDLKDLLTDEDSLRTKLGLSEEVWKDKKNEVIASLLGYRINMGGLPKNEAWMIYNRYGKDMYEHALQKRQEFRDWKTYAQEHGLIKGSGFEGFANFAKEHPGMIGVLLALLALGGAQVLAPGWTAAKLATVGKGIGIGAQNAAWSRKDVASALNPFD